MRMIPEWRKAWRMASVQIGALAVLWIALPADTQAAILNLIGVDAHHLPGIVGVAVIIARLISQPAVREAD